MSKSLANRFIKYLPKLINDNQTGYVKGRNISENIRTIADILEYLKDNSQPGILINIDFEKAFDSLNWEFLLATLEKFNFGPSFIHWVEILYKNISSCIINNGHTSGFFKVGRGVRQGDPLSPYLFIMVAEIMASKIRQTEDIKGLIVKEKEHKIMQYADDTSGILKDLISAKKFLKIVKEFGQYSGLNLNVEKTEGMWLGSNRFKNTKPLGIVWPDRPLRILGIYFSYNQDACEQLNFIERIDKANRIINMWLSRNLTMYGRCQIIRTFVMSQFMYAASSIAIPPRVINMINKLIFRFMWRNKKERLKRTVLMNSISNGGMKVPDFQTISDVARLKWISKIQTNSDATWKLILEDYLDKCDIKLNVLLYSNFSTKSLGVATASLPMFYKELLKLWSEIGNTVPVNKHDFLWYNRDICVKKKSLYYHELFTAGAWYINDLFKNDGTPIPFETWISRGVGRTFLIKWAGLINITRKMRTIQINHNKDEALQLSILTKGPIMQLNSKLIYYEVLANKIGHTVYVPRISKYIENVEDIDWQEVYTKANTVPTDTKTKEFQFRFIHDLLANKYWLCKWHLSDSAICTHCNNVNENEETISHLFWDCSKIGIFWKEFEAFWETRGHFINIHKEDVFFGVDEHFMSGMIFTAKMYIYNKRTHDEPIHILGYSGYVAMQKRMEFLIAKDNNMMEHWVDRWSNITI